MCDLGIRKKHSSDMSDTFCYGLIRDATDKFGNDTVSYGVTRVNACALRMKAVLYCASKCVVRLRKV